MKINSNYRYFLRNNISRINYFYILLSMIHKVIAQSEKRKLTIDPDTYTSKTVSEYFLSNPVTFFIMIWMCVHVFLGILFFCFLSSERSLMKPTSVTL
ncbi:hypothetical protein cmbei_6004926 [Cryptosporidium meleagridis]